MLNSDEILAEWWLENKNGFFQLIRMFQKKFLMINLDFCIKTGEIRQKLKAIKMPGLEVVLAKLRDSVRFVIK